MKIAWEQNHPQKTRDTHTHGQTSTGVTYFEESPRVGNHTRRQLFDFGLHLNDRHEIAHALLKGWRGQDTWTGDATKRKKKEKGYDDKTQRKNNK